MNNTRTKGRLNGLFVLIFSKFILRQIPQKNEDTNKKRQNYQRRKNL